MAFVGLELTLSQEASFRAPPDYVFSARTATLLPGATAPIALFVSTVDYHGDAVTRCLGYLSSPWTKSAELRLDLAVGGGEEVTFSLRAGPAKGDAGGGGGKPGAAAAATVHLCGFINPTSALEGVVEYNSS